MKKGHDFPISHLAILRKEIGLTQKEIADKIECDIKTYRNYELCKQRPDGDMLLRIRSFYADNNIQVSTDYLLGVSDFRTPENDYIGNTTGLSEPAINNLTYYKKYTNKYGISPEHALDIVNFLLVDKDGEKLLAAVYDYLFGNFTKTKSGDTTFEVLDDTEIPCNGGEISVKDFNAYFLASIVQTLSKIKTDLSKYPASKFYGKFNPDGANELQKAMSRITSIRS